MLMRAHNGAVDHAQAVGRALRKGAENMAPHAALGPAVEAIVGRRVRPITLGQIAPRCAGPQDEEDAVQHLPVILTRTTPHHLAVTARQQRGDDRPLPIRQIEPSDHGHLQVALNQNSTRPSTDFEYRT
jgi:hypothetical protein